MEGLSKVLTGTRRVEAITQTSIRSSAASHIRQFATYPAIHCPYQVAIGSSAMCTSPVATSTQRGRHGTCLEAALLVQFEATQAMRDRRGNVSPASVRTAAITVAAALLLAAMGTA